MMTHPGKEPGGICVTLPAWLALVQVQEAVRGSCRAAGQHEAPRRPQGQAGARGGAEGGGCRGHGGQAGAAGGLMMGCEQRMLVSTTYEA